MTDSKVAPHVRRVTAIARMSRQVNASSRPAAALPIALLIAILTLALAGCESETAPSEQSPAPNLEPVSPAPQAIDDPVISGGQCGDPAQPIVSIQGSGLISPMVDTQVSVEGTVTGNFQEGMRGIFVEDDSRMHTEHSSGLFVFLGDDLHEINAGDQIRVSGTVSEFGDPPHTLTQLSGVTDLQICGQGAVLRPTFIAGEADASMREAHEGMLVSLDDQWYVTGHSELAVFGTLALSWGERMMMPTQKLGPGEQAAELLASDPQRVIHLDDGSTAAYPRTLPFAMDANHSVRLGDKVLAPTGILDQRFGAWRIQPVGSVSIASVNKRLSGAPVLDGELRVAGFNLGNFFNGSGGRFQQGRGASNSIEFERQLSKLGATLALMPADIIAVMELENDGYSGESAIASLTAAANDVAKTDAFSFIDAGVGKLGWDVITVGILYRSDRVKPVGNPATLASDTFQRKNRPPLAQTFEMIDGGARVTVVAVHLKSKGRCEDAEGPDQDNNLGQGCWNGVRVAAAKELAQWALNKPTSADDGDVIVIGDFNAYRREQPFTTMADAGLVPVNFGANPYTSSWRSYSGQIDHAFVTQGLSSQLRSAVIWHINADEPSLLDWSLKNRSRAQLDSLYSSNPSRSSDHDPILIGLNPTP